MLSLPRTILQASSLEWKLHIREETGTTPAYFQHSISSDRISILGVKAENGWDNLNKKIYQWKDDEHLLHPAVQEKGEKFITYGRSAYIFP